LTPCSPELYKARKARQHPLYQTSAAEVGKVPRGVTVTLAPPEAGLRGEFSKNFASSGAFRYGGLSTAMPRSKFHSAFDGVR
jgi:hypothetical protein